MNQPPLTWTVTMPSMERIEAAASALWQVMNHETSPVVLDWAGMIEIGRCDEVMNRMRRRAYAVLVAAEGID